jgi:hypothetical protein
MNHTELTVTALESIKAVFGDTSVDQATTRSSLEELRDEIEVMLDTLPSKMERTWRVSDRDNH